MKLEKVSIVEETGKKLRSSIQSNDIGVVAGWKFQSNLLITGFFSYDLSKKDDNHFRSFLPEGIDIHGTYGEVASFSSNSYNLHVTMHGETLVYLKPDSTQLNLATVTTEQAVNTLSDMLVLFQIRGLVDVKIGTKKDKVEIIVKDDFLSDMIFSFVSDNRLLISSVFGEQSIKQAAITKKDANRLGVTTFERFFTPEQIRISLCISSSVPSVCPTITHHVGYELVPVFIDALCFADANTLMTDLPGIFRSAVERQMYLFQKKIIEDKLASETTIAVPEFCHFITPNCCHPVTICYPRNLQDSALADYRKDFLHPTFSLPVTKPLFRRSLQKYSFSSPFATSALVSPHHSVRSPSLQHATLHLVDGLYTYHHYMQDNINDNGWGCAYRSLQTIISWLKYQGYTSEPIPTHQKIQQLAVETGDRQSSFVGSKEWLGAVEIGNILTEYTGIRAKILFVSRGSEMGGIGRQLALYFDMGGSPIMIGGGVLAHTILGVAFSSITGETQFLVLDPHYIGPENSDKIIAKGWCGWKPVSFWKPSAFYNLCLPQIPSEC